MQGRSEYVTSVIIHKKNKKMPQIAKICQNLQKIKLKSNIKSEKMNPNVWTGFINSLYFKVDQLNKFKE